MNARIASAVAALAVLGFLVWVAARAPEPSPSVAAAAPVDSLNLTEERGGSAVPCAVPLAWRIARVDPQFGLSRKQARNAVARAAHVWEEAVGRTLFRNDSTNGFPVRLVYGDRQLRSMERERVEETFQRESDSLDARRAVLTREVQDVAEEVAGIESDRAALERRARRHNLAVEDWNRRGGAPAAVRTQLDAEGKRLEEDRNALSVRARKVDAHQKSLIAEQTRYNERVRDHQRAADSLSEAYPAERVESGVYREAVRTRNGKPVAVSREIRIFRFDDPDDLERVAAHELGHALGLGHAPEKGAIMSATYGKDDTPSGAPVVEPADTALLHARCPGL